MDCRWTFAGFALLAVATACAGADLEKLEDCRLLPNESNDGDSFHVRHGTHEYIFRLYFVDCPEAEDAVPERVQEQADYFHLSPAEVIKAGREAARFTSSELRGGSFTVYTKWEDAMGSSELKRYFAFVFKDKKDLAELLAANGLCRVYGKMVDRPDGRQSGEVSSHLDGLLQSAKRSNRGIWGHLDKVETEGWFEVEPDDGVPPAAPVAPSAPQTYNTITSSGRATAFTPQPPYKPIGEFSPGTQLEIIAQLPDGMVLVRHRAESGKLTIAACKSFELGVATAP